MRLSVEGALLALSLAGTVAGQGTSRVSVDSAGTQGNENSYYPSISADGRYVAFWSDASNLVAGDTNGNPDVFVRDRQSGTTERVSVDSAGTQGNDASGLDGLSISADGRYVAFNSWASNLVPGDTNGFPDVFVRDRQSGTTERVSVDSAGTQGNNQSLYPSISADGRYVAFRSDAANLVVPPDLNFWTDVFVRDRQSGTTELASVDPAGGPGDNNSGFFDLSISADGRYVAFHSEASNLVPGDTNAWEDVFVRDRQSATTERVSVDSAGTQGNGDSVFLSISADCRYVAFYSEASNLVPGDTNAWGDVFVRDRQNGTTERASVDSAGTQGNDASGFYGLSISADGRYVAFRSEASNLVAGDTNGTYDVFVRDRQSGTTERVSVDSTGMQGNGASDYPSISADGSFVAFESYASNLVPGDTNTWEDVFVRDSEPTSSLAFCFPEIGGVRSCPCGNPATAVDRGCDNFATTSTVSGTGGAMLLATGVPSASIATTLVFHVTQAHNPGSNTNLHVFWKGTSTLAVGVKSGFGVRCVAGTLKRIYQGSGTGTGGLGSTNAVDFPNGTQTTDAWTASQMPAAGATLYYYDSYRDQQGPTNCNTANDRFNVSHALAITWGP